MNFAEQFNFEYHKAVTRRHFLKTSSMGLGSLALASLFNNDLFAGGAGSSQGDPLAPKLADFAPKAKRVIYLHMSGSPSQLDLFDYKPKLQQLSGEPCPDSLLKNERFAFIKGVPTMLGTPYKFHRYGRSGIELSELLPHLGEVIDDVAVVKTVHTEQFNHAPAQLFVFTGAPRLGRPSMGSWVTYGLGSEAHDLPAFVVLVSGGKKPSGGASLWGSGFLPTVYQGVQCRSEGDPILYVSDPSGMNRTVRRDSLDALKDLNEMQLQEVGDPETMTRIQQYELAYRMQASVPELTNIADEPKPIQEMYGIEPGKASFANNCLLARRLIERGTRFVQLFHWGWDQHGNSGDNDLIHGLKRQTVQTDKACAALIKDLKQRGLLDETLIVWGGEFGRTPMNEERGGSKFLGRDHHPHCFTMWMAGGGIKGGLTYGQTDDIGYHIAENPVSVHDIQATILDRLGLKHKQLTYKFQGRDFRLTDVGGKVIDDILV